MKISWKGGKCPVTPETEVRVWLRNGSAHGQIPTPARNWRWTQVDYQPEWDIVAYEVVEVGEEPKVAELTASQRRKLTPVFSGFLMYFPLATQAVAEHSRRCNDKHNPGEPLHWAKGKSTDQADCIARHLIDIGPTWDAQDPEFEGALHATALAWRAMALLETVLERKREAGK